MEGSLSQYELGGEANVPVYSGKGFRLTAGAQYRFNRLDFANAPGPLGNLGLDLHRVDIPFNLWKDLGPRWKLWARLQPGWYSDFGSIGSDDFILTSLVLASYRWNEITRIAFGAFYSRDLGEERVLPALGFIFEPNPHWSLALTFPRIEAAYAPSEDWLFTARALLSGAGWNIADPAGGAFDVDLNYRSIRVGLGAEHRVSGPWWAFAEAGAQLAQELEILAPTYRFQQDLGTALFLNGGVRARF